MSRFECNRCHEGTGLPPVELAKNCFSCHQQILDGRFPVSAAALARFRPHVLSARDAPSLTAIAERLEPSWVRGYLLSPRDLRPKLTPTMPRLALDERQAEDIVSYLMRDAKRSEPTPRALGNAARGRELIEQKGCTSCHAFGESRRLRRLIPRLKPVTSREPRLWLPICATRANDFSLRSCSSGYSTRGL